MALESPIFVAGKPLPQEIGVKLMTLAWHLKPRMKRHIVGTTNRRMSKDGIALRGVGIRTPTSRRFCSVFFKIDRIHYFDILFFRVSFLIKRAAFQASGGARMRLHKTEVSFAIKLASLAANAGAET